METAQETHSMPRIGDKAPEFKAVTTQGDVHFPNDYAGSWVVFFSHPGLYLRIHHLCHHGRSVQAGEH